MKKILGMFSTLMLIFLLGISSTMAASFSFDGDMIYYSDVVEFNFSLDDSCIVSLWADSYNDGAGFDTIFTLWDSDGNYLAHNDDHTSSNTFPEQDGPDSSIVGSFAGGDYLLTLTLYGNYRNGQTLADGFRYDTFGAIEITGGTYYNVNFDNVDYAGYTSDQNPTAPVPEPATVLLLGAGLSFLGLVQRRRAKA